MIEEKRHQKVRWVEKKNKIMQNEQQQQQQEHLCLFNIDLLKFLLSESFCYHQQEATKDKDIYQYEHIH